MNKKIKEIFEFNVGLSHIIMLACFLIIFSYVFYLIGYNAGNKKRINNYTQVEENNNETTVSFKDENGQVAEEDENLIKEELDRHKRFIKQPDGTTQIKPKTISSEKKDPPKSPPLSPPKKKIDKKIEEKKNNNKNSLNNKAKVNKVIYSIQVGAFNNYKDAQKFANKFIKMSYPSEIKAVKIGNNNWYRVYVGKFNTKEKAEKIKGELQKKVNKKDFFVTKMN